MLFPVIVGVWRILRHVNVWTEASVFWRPHMFGGHNPFAVVSAEFIIHTQNVLIFTSSHVLCFHFVFFFIKFVKCRSAWKSEYTRSRSFFFLKLLLPIQIINGAPRNGPNRIERCSKPDDVITWGRGQCDTVSVGRGDRAVLARFSSCPVTRWASVVSLIEHLLFLEANAE